MDPQCRQSLLVLLLLFGSVYSSDEDDYVDKTLPINEWVDPSDMVDPQIDKRGENKGFLSSLYTSTMDKLRTKSSGGESGKTIENAFANLQADLSDCQNKLSSTSQQLKTKETATCDIPHFKQFVRTLLEATTEVNPKTSISLDAEGRDLLNKFLIDNTNVHDASEILIKSISNTKTSTTMLSQSWELFNVYFNRNTVIALTCVCLLVFCIVSFEMTTPLSAQRQFLCCIVICFVLSIPWEWYRLYKLQFASKQAEMLKKLPKQCQPDHEVGPWESLGMWWRSSFQFADDPCAKYQEALLVDPLWEVAPSRAVAVTVTRFFIQPLEYIAEAFGKSFRILFKEVPIQWQPFMFIALFIITILCLLLVSGIEVNLPFFKIGVGRGTRGDANLQRLENQVQNLTGVIQQLNNPNAPALRDVEEVENRAAAGQLVELVNAMNQRNEIQQTQLREIEAHLRLLKPTAQQAAADPVENQDWELVGPRHEERPRHRGPVQASDHETNTHVEQLGPREG